MSTALVQALQRLLVIAIVGALSAVGLNLTVLNGALGTNAILFIPILTAIIDAALKWLGGATVPQPALDNYALSRDYKQTKPPFWAV